MSPKEVEKALESFPELGRYQLVIKRPHIMDELTVRVECTQPLNHKEIEQKLIELLKDSIRLTAKIELVSKGTIKEGADILLDHRKL